jgi:hypothetical protein
MAITVEFFNFSKRRNSTAIPTGAAQKTASVLLKDDCTLENPVFELKAANIAEYGIYNYVHVSDFGRYYFIVNRTYKTGSVVVIQCTVDVLASFKAAIQGQTGVFIEYSSTPTTSIIDGRMQRLTVPIVTESYSALANTTFTENGCVILSTTGNKCTGTFILADAGHIYDLLDGIDWTTTTVAGTTIEDITLNGFQRMCDVMEQFFTKDSASRNIRNAFTLPWVVHHDAIGAQISNYVIGSFPTGETVYKVANKVILDSATLNIPWQQNDWRRSSANCQLYMYAPLFGVMSLPVDQLVNDSSLAIQYTFSYENGDVALSVKSGSTDQIITTANTNVAAPVGVGASNISSGKVTSSVTSIISGLATMAIAESTSGGLAGLLAAASGGIGLADALGGQTLAGGGLGGFASVGLDKVCHIWCVGAQLSDTPANMASGYGYPNFCVGSLAGKTGYVKLRNSTFNGAGSSYENDMITEYMNRGFYIE